MMLARILCGLGIAILVPLAALHAQISLGAQKPLIIAMSPQNPSPGERVRLSIQSYALDLDRSDITWRANGTIIDSGPGVKETTITAPALGMRMDITVNAVDSDGNEGSGDASVRPSEIDILWDSDSYVPPFFKGRALPGSNATIHAYAFVRFESTDGIVSEKNIIYTWRRNGAVVASGRGISSVSIPGPAPFGTDAVSVDAESADRTWKGSLSIAIPAQDPHLVLYENHPLFGVLYHRAIVGEVNAGDVEQKVTAVPYFAHIETPRDATLSYEWTVNNAPIVQDPHDPQTLTIRADSYTGPADVTLSLTNTADLFMRAKGVWHIVFGKAASGSFFGTNLFGQ